MGKNKNKIREEERTNKKNTWKMIGVISIIIMLAGTFIIGSNWNAPDESVNANKTITSLQAKVLAEEYVKENMFGVDNAVVLNVSDAGNVWLVVFDLDNNGEEIVDSYVTKDGKYFIPAAYKINEEIISTPSQPANLSNILISNSSINLLYFWGDGCSYCAQMEEFLQELDSEMAGKLNIMKYETWNDQDNVALMNQVASNYGFEPRGVPLLFIGDKYFVGSSDSIHNEIKDYISSNCLDQLETCQLKI